MGQSYHIASLFDIREINKLMGKKECAAKGSRLMSIKADNQAIPYANGWIIGVK
ncbi:hypothetical protein FC99_GL000932 [Levilactobacillus koreensis JCM 16448]|nr:hypothetical protein FC99_GL000932 [Levilactobacillus koreensis JCM 16448]